MGGGLMQLVAYGAQDIYLTGNPQITFFKVVYRRHTNFSMETISQTLNGNTASVIDGSATCTISRNGDLVHKVYVTADSSTATNGSALVNEVELEIGGQRIDRHYQEWNEVWNELSTDESKAIGLKAMQCEIGTGNTDAVETVQIPLNFWFCRNPGLALPLIALQYHEVKLKFTWGTAGIALNPEVWCDYIYLDTDERRRFAQVSHEYLIEQLQKETYTSGAGDKKLNFNHPVKELIWVNDSLTNPEGIKYQLKLNGHDRFAEQPKDYFILRQPFDYHTAVPRQNLPSAAQLVTAQYTVGDDLLASTELASATTLGGTAIGTDQAAATGQQLLVGTLTGATAAGAAAEDIEAVDTAPTATNLIFGCLNAEIGGSSTTLTTTMSIGRMYEITGSGSRFIAGSAVGSKIVARLTTLVLGSNDTTSGANSSVSNTMALFQFDRILATSTATVMLNDELKIEAIKEVLPNTEQLSQARTSKMTKEINVYSFALKPEEHQPSGTCNFSRIDNAQLKVTGADGGGRIYAVNYNVLRIMSGMGGLAYSN